MSWTVEKRIEGKWVQMDVPGTIGNFKAANKHAQGFVQYFGLDFNDYRIKRTK